MLFRAPGKTQTFQYSNGNPYQIATENNQKSMINFNHSYTLGQKCLSQEKFSRNNDQRFFNYPPQGVILKTEPATTFQQSRYRPSSYYKSPTNAQIARVTTYMENNSGFSVEQQCLILRKQKSQLSEKVRKVEDELHTKENVIRGKQRQIEQLKHIHTQSMNSIKPYQNQNENQNVVEIKKQKQKLYFQVIQLQAELHKLKDKYQKMQKEHNNLTSKYDEFTNKPSQEQSRKFKKEEVLESELILAERRNQRIKTQYQKQLASLKDKVRELQQSNYNKSAVFSYTLNNMSEIYSSGKGSSQAQTEYFQNRIQKLHQEINQKNEMIRYLEVQCAKKRDSNDVGSNEMDINRISNLYEQSRKQLSKILKQNDTIKKQSGLMLQKLGKAEKLIQQYKKQIKDLEYLLKQIKNKEHRTTSAHLNEQNRALNKIQKEVAEKYESKIKELQSQLKRVKALPKIQGETVHKRYQNLIEEERLKNQNQIRIKSEQLRQSSMEKQKLIQKIDEYRSILRLKDEQIAKIEQQKNKMEEMEQERRAIESKVIGDLNNNMGVLQKQFKMKVQELFKSQSSRISLEKELISMRSALEQKANEITANINKFEEQKRRLEQQKRASQFEVERLKVQNQQKSAAHINYEEEIKQMQEKYNVLIKRNEQKYENVIGNSKEENRKLLNLIAQYERTNLNLAIEVESQKQKKKKIEKLYQELREQKNTLEGQHIKLKQKISSSESKQSSNQTIQSLQLSLSNKDKLIEQKNIQLEIKQQYIFKLQSQLAQSKIKYELLEQRNIQTTNSPNQLKASVNEKVQQNMVNANTNEVTSQKYNKKQEDDQERIKEFKLRLEQKQNELARSIKQKQDQISRKNIQIEQLKSKLAQNQRAQAQKDDYQTKVTALQTKISSQKEQIQLMKKIIKQQERVSFEQRESLKEKDKYSKQIEAQLEELSQQLMEIRNKLEDAELQRTKGNIQIEEEQRTLKLSKTSNMSSQSFIADYIEIDKNALLHICDLLGIEPVEGGILKSIIQYIESSEYLKIQPYYKEILQLFGIDTEITDKTQEKLIGEIKTFRTTITSLLEKATILEDRYERILKDNHRMNKQIGSMKLRQHVANQLQDLLSEQNSQIIKDKLKVFNKKFEKKDEQQILQQIKDDEQE